MPLRSMLAGALVALAALPVRAAPHRTLAFLGVQADAQDRGQTGTLEDSFLDALSADGYFTRVTGTSDVAALLGFERFRQLSGCSDDGCIAELAGALGVDYVGQARVGRLGDVTVLNLKIIDVQAGEVAARAMRRVRSASGLPDAVEALARAVVVPLRARDIRTGRVLPPPLALAFVPFGVGQFANRSPVKGAAFLVAEAAAFTVFGLSLGQFESSKLPGSGGLFQGGTFRDPAAASNLQTTYLVSFWTGVALCAAGVVDALVERP